MLYPVELWVRSGAAARGGLSLARIIVTQGSGFGKRGEIGFLEWEIAGRRKQCEGERGGMK